MSRPPPSLEDLDFATIAGDDAPAVKPLASTPEIENEGLIGERALRSAGYHVVMARTRGSLPGKSMVLIVEDDDDTAALAARALRNAGYATSRAGSARETAHFLGTIGIPALILLDVELPGLDGFKMLAQLRAHPRLAPIPIVMFTGKGTREDVIRGITLGADGYVVKPVKPATLVEVVGKVLGK